MNLEQSREHLQAISLKAQEALINRILNNVDAQESWWDDESYRPPNRLSRPYHEETRVRPYFATIDDRSEGRHSPYYEYYEDVTRNLQSCRNLRTLDGVVEGAVSSLRSYIVGGEWLITTAPVENGKPVDPKKEVDKNVTKLLNVCDDIFYRYVQENKWSEKIIPWINDEAIMDGEVFLHIFPRGNDVIQTDYIFPEQIHPPHNELQLNDFLQTPNSHWEFGVHAVKLNKRFNYSDPMGFHVMYDSGGTDWSYIPSWPQPAYSLD